MEDYVYQNKRVFGDMDFALAMEKLKKISDWKKKSDSDERSVFRKNETYTGWISFLEYKGNFFFSPV